jgi:hypothetical protein
MMLPEEALRQGEPDPLNRLFFRNVETSATCKMCVVLPRILARETRCASPVASLPALMLALRSHHRNVRPFHQRSGEAFLPLPIPTQTRRHRRLDPRPKAYAAFGYLHHAVRAWRRPGRFRLSHGPIEQEAISLSSCTTIDRRASCRPSKPASRVRVDLHRDSPF